MLGRKARISATIRRDTSGDYAGHRYSRLRPCSRHSSNFTTTQHEETIETKNHLRKTQTLLTLVNEETEFFCIYIYDYNFSTAMT